jgi:hypothetical protein
MELVSRDHLGRQQSQRKLCLVIHKKLKHPFTITLRK